jgi:hypothetical protein
VRKPATKDYRHMRNKYNISQHYKWTLFIITVCSLCFLAASLIAPVIHKHCPSHAGDVKDYDASCYWIKTIKSHRCNNCGFDQQLWVFSISCLLLVTFSLLYKLEDLAEGYHSTAPFRLVSVRGPPDIFC